MPLTTTSKRGDHCRENLNPGEETKAVILLFCYFELSEAYTTRIDFKKKFKQAGAELCQAQGSAKFTASYPLANG